MSTWKRDRNLHMKRKGKFMTVVLVKVNDDVIIICNLVNEIADRPISLSFSTIYSAEIVKKPKKRDEEESGPKWMQGLVVKPDAKWRNRQLSTYGIMSLVGILLPPVIDKMLMIQLLIVIGQLIWRGVPREDGGYNLFGNSDGGGSHKKVAWLLGASIFFAGKLLVFALMPNALRGSKWAEIGGFCAENVLYMTANMFLQPYKG